MSVAKSARIGRKYTFWACAGALVVVLVAGGGQWIRSEMGSISPLRGIQEQSDRNSDTCMLVSAIEEVQWPEGGASAERATTLSQTETAFVLELMGKEQPYVIKGCPLGHDRGWERWTPEFLREEGPAWAAGVHEGSEERFLYYNRGTAMEEMALHNRLVHGRHRDGRRASVPAGPDYRTHSLPLEEVLQEARGDASDGMATSGRRENDAVPSFLYWSTEIRSLGPKLAADIRRTLSQFVLPSERTVQIARKLLGYEEGYQEAGGEHINAWVGEEGVTASLHYDTSHNFYFQQYGEKQFLLLPPERAWNVYLGPALHPHYRRSQVGDLFHAAYTPPCRAREAELWPLLDVRGAHSAVLSAGDVLYLPPYWLHHVTAVSYSLSVNVWHNSEQYWEAEGAAASPIPLEAEWSEEQLMCGTIAFLSELIEQCTHQQEEEALHASWPQLQRSRVVQEMSACEGEVTRPSRTALFLARLLHSRYEQALGVVPKSDPLARHWRGTLASCALMEDWGEESLEERLQRGMIELRKHFLAPSLSPSVRGLLISNYVEALVSAFAGIEHVQPLLQEWLAHSLCP